MSKKPTHQIVIAEKFSNGTGQEKNHYTNIGSAWALERGGYSCEIRAGLSVSGRFAIFPIKGK